MKKLIILCAFVWLCTGCEAILEDDISNQQVVILAPTEGAQLATGEVTFSWQTLDNATSYTCLLYTSSYYDFRKSI